MSFNDIHFREATLCDKQAVLNLRHNVYGGLDYLPDYFEYFVQDKKNRRCIVGELNSELVQVLVQNTIQSDKRKRFEYDGKVQWNSATSGSS